MISSVRRRRVILVAMLGLFLVGTSVAVASVVGTAASAQEEPNETSSEYDLTNATPINTDTVITGEVGPHERDIYVIRTDVSAGQAIVGNFTSSVSFGPEEDGSVGLLLTVFGPNGPPTINTPGQSIAVAFSENENTAQFGNVAPGTGRYYISIEGPGNSSGPYRFTVETHETDAFEPNQNRSYATFIPSDATVSGEIVGSDRDVFAFNTTPGETITVEFTRRTADGAVLLSLPDQGLSPEVDITPRTLIEISNTTTVQLRGTATDSVTYFSIEGRGTLTEATMGHYQFTLSTSQTDEEPPTETQTPTETAPPHSNTIIIKSTADERVYYEFAATGGIEPGPKADLVEAEQPDTISGTTASGSTAQGGVDGFTYSGEITALDLRGGPATVLVNGEQVDPDSFPSISTSTPTATPSPTPTATPTATPTPAPTATPTSTPTATPTVTPTSTPTAIPTATATPTGTSSTTSPPQRTSRSPSPSATGSAVASAPITSSASNTSPAGRLLTTATDGNADGQSTGFGAGFGIPIAVIIVLSTGLVASRLR